MAEQRTGAYNNPNKFNAKELDEETGFYYYGARYYTCIERSRNAPRISLWLSVDPLAEKTLDPYGYCYNNPINLVDPSGMSVENPDDIIIRTWDSETESFKVWATIKSTQLDEKIDICEIPEFVTDPNYPLSSVPMRPDGGYLIDDQVDGEYIADIIYNTAGKPDAISLTLGAGVALTEKGGKLEGSLTLFLTGKDEGKKFMYTSSAWQGGADASAGLELGLIYSNTSNFSSETLSGVYSFASASLGPVSATAFQGWGVDNSGLIPIPKTLYHGYSVGFSIGVKALTPFTGQVGTGYTSKPSALNCSWVK